jgi:hypothetical protein
MLYQSPSPVHVESTFNATGTAAAASVVVAAVEVAVVKDDDLRGAVALEALALEENRDPPGID